MFEFINTTYLRTYMLSSRHVMDGSGFRMISKVFAIHGSLLINIVKAKP